MATLAEKKEFLHKAYRDISFFVSSFMKHYIKNEIPDFHLELYGLVKKEKRLLVAAPRGFAKSMICSVFYIMWCICFKQKKKILMISASEEKAVEFLRMIKSELESNALIKAFFGNQVGKGKWTEGNLVTSTGIEIRAKGASGQIRGYRPDLIVLDDIETEESVATADRRKKTEILVSKDCIPALTADGQLVWIGTVITTFAVICEKMEEDNGWVKRKYQAYLDGIEDQEHCLWPELWDHERLQARKREIGSTFFACEYMNDPLSDDSAPIKRHHIQRWNNLDELPSNMVYVIAVDPAYSEDQKADEKVAARIGLDSNGKRWLVDLINTRESLNDFMHMVINLYNANRANTIAVGVPNSGVEKGFFNSFVNECSRLNATVPITELSNTFVGASGTTHKNKKSRVIAALQPLFEQGRYVIGAHHKEAADQLLTIGSSKHDDIVDALTYAEQLLVGVNNTMIECEFDRYGHRIEQDTDNDLFGYDYD